MTKVITPMECKCESCNGGNPAPEGHYGGSMCLCNCHQLKGKKKQTFIDEKNKLFGDLKSVCKSSNDTTDNTTDNNSGSYKGSCYCGKCGKPFIYVGDIIGDMKIEDLICTCYKEVEIAPPSTPALQGWICPRCGRGNSPYNNTCPCLPCEYPQVTFY